jgi:hypothetical protein
VGRFLAAAGGFRAGAALRAAAGRGAAAFAPAAGLRAGLLPLTRCVWDFVALVAAFFFAFGTGFFRTPPPVDDRPPLRPPAGFPARDRRFGAPPEVLPVCLTLRLLAEPPSIPCRA